MIALAIALIIHGGPQPVMATWYQTPGIMRNGERYDPLALTCAVDDSKWEEMQGDTIILARNGRAVEVTVTDSGYLREAGVDLDCTPAVFDRLGELDEGRIECLVVGG